MRRLVVPVIIAVLAVSCAAAARADDDEHVQQLANALTGTDLDAAQRLEVARQAVAWNMPFTTYTVSDTVAFFRGVRDTKLSARQEIAAYRIWEIGDPVIFPVRFFVGLKRSTLDGAHQVQAYKILYLAAYPAKAGESLFPLLAAPHFFLRPSIRRLPQSEQIKRLIACAIASNHDKPACLSGP